MITVIGNGESRKSINISKIDGIKIGCNAIYLYEKVDYICAMDKFWRDKITKESIIPLISRVHNNSFQSTLELYQGGKWINTNCPFRGYCSGITALDFMANSVKNEDIYLIGFDFNYAGTTVNHMYKDTKNHPKSTRPAQNENIFLTQFLETVKRYPRNKFYWVSDSDFLIKIKGINNLHTVSLEQYKENVYVEKIFR